MARKARGFTLIEVLFALALFGMATVTLLEGVRMSLFTLDIVRQTRDYEDDYRFVLRQILIIEEREELEDGGEIETLNAGEAVWEAELEETELVDLFKLDLVVRFPDAGDGYAYGSEGPEPFETTLYILRPGWMEEPDRDALLEDKRQALEDARPWFSP
jgi:prepilin-type N-terminal cleavage/methylation domain-containing protein